ncbi:hypothetical protein [Frankia sp. R82]|uniref:hypothetical protein n=1 Tax=Frankia sp. R82 TaxID=2950553 RepID=UPI0020449291|nr:hypothetical protein [Frankia sp. R82]MCM3884708.1 hypothetical protein [Frankia sp. R82]
MSGARGRVYGRDRREGQDASDWLAARIPAGWFTGPPEVVVDRDEITVIGELAPEPDGTDADRIRRFRERTRDERIMIATEAEHRYGRKVAWGAASGDTSELFTVLSVPVMTRLRQRERQVLDTLVDSGVARSRSEALAWCVRLVGDNADIWLRQLREAMEHVEKIRAEGPGRPIARGSDG